MPGPKDTERNSPKQNSPAPGETIKTPDHERRPILQGQLELLKSIPRAVLLREAGLAVLPLLLSFALLTVSALPAFHAIRVTPTTFGFYAYQALVQDVQAYRLTLLDHHVTPEQVSEAHQRVLSSTRTPGQFASLTQVETFGDATLKHIDLLMTQNTPESVEAAAREAIQLNAQTSNYVNSVIAQNGQSLKIMRVALLGTAFLTGLLSAALIARALWFWRVERERQLKRDARQREALSMASHELRRPLQRLLLLSDLLRQVESQEERQQLLSQIEDSAAQIASRADLSRLNDLYLDVSLKLSRRDLRPVVRTTAAPHSRVRLFLPETPINWTFDVDRVRQMLENLIENALKYTYGPVEVTLDMHAGQPRIQVRDFGEGISSASMEKIFLPYERGPRGLIQGQGLGLSLVRRYARAHGGDVILSRPQSGPGLVVNLTLGHPDSTMITMNE